jgi:hypothetical protein
MLHFFRKIRHKLLSGGKTGRYLKYAIGEIILVVLGILIALQVDNWNTSRIEQDQLEAYAKLLVNDLEEDIKMTKFSMYQASESIKRIDSLIRYVQNKSIEDISNLDFLCLSSATGYRPFSWNRATLEELKSSGSLQSMKDDSLKMKITQYDAFTHHLDQDNVNDHEASRNCNRLISQIINKNYSNYLELRKIFRLFNAVDSSGFLEFSELTWVDLFSTPEYKIAEAQGIGLITDDINKVHSAINSLISLQYMLEIRVGTELPKVIKDSEELIALLKEFYLH